MSDMTIFFVGTIVTILWGSVIAPILWAIIEDDKKSQSAVEDKVTLRQNNAGKNTPHPPFESTSRI